MLVYLELHFYKASLFFLEHICIITCKKIYFKSMKEYFKFVIIFYRLDYKVAIC